MELDSLPNRPRIARRELFNQYFRVDDPYNNENAWPLEERYRDVQSLLFEKLVLEPADLPIISYGFVQPSIRVEPTSSACPVMLNREIASGYWDSPPRKVAREAKLVFVSIFDWDRLGYRDHRYVRVRVTEWPSHPEVIGKHAFIETHYVRFIKG
jgi:hypothetical protein